jgi:chromosome segregation ATPase
MSANKRSASVDSLGSTETLSSSSYNNSAKRVKLEDIPALLEQQIKERIEELETQNRKLASENRTLSKIMSDEFKKSAEHQAAKEFLADEIEALRSNHQQLQDQVASLERESSKLQNTNACLEDINQACYELDLAFDKLKAATGLAACMLGFEEIQKDWDDFDTFFSALKSLVEVAQRQAE